MALLYVYFEPFVWGDISSTVEWPSEDGPDGHSRVLMFACAPHCCFGAGGGPSVVPLAGRLVGAENPGGMYDHQFTFGGGSSGWRSKFLNTASCSMYGRM